MDIKKVFDEALGIINERGKAYGVIENNFQRAAALATLKLNKAITAYDVAVIMESVKDARRATGKLHWDSHIDGLNYKVFAAALSGAKPAGPVPVAAEADAPVKRGPGRPRKHPIPDPATKRKRGRPRKNAA